MNIEELELMMSPAVSKRWNFERSCVYQKYNKYPDKFLPGSTAYLENGNARGIYVITREGMEHLR